jgi:putative hydrolase of the HAD superfamily
MADGAVNSHAGPGAIDAVAFDLDGTLYPNYRLNLLLLPFILKEWRFLRALGMARNRIRALQEERESPGGADFYDTQAALMAEILGSGDALRVREKMETLVYRGWEPLFRKIRPFPHVEETLRALKGAGFPLALLSDFPPKRKLANMGLGGFWELVLCTEEEGRLKPDPAPFALLSEKLKIPAGRILYVGNSAAYDVRGAKRAGMRAAFMGPRLFSPPEADFCFHDYRQLLKYVIN